jgi:AraC family transcriptional regulator
MTTGEPNQPEIVEAESRTITGLSGNYSDSTASQIPQLWQRFIPYLDKIPGRTNRETVGVCVTERGSDNFQYIAGVDIAAGSALVHSLVQFEIPATHYAVFPHHGHVSQLQNAVGRIFCEWFPQSGYVPGLAGKPGLIERYTEAFNPQTGTGGIEIWIPVKPKPTQP